MCADSHVAFRLIVGASVLRVPDSGGWMRCMVRLTI